MDNHNSFFVELIRFELMVSLAETGQKTMQCSQSYLKISIILAVPGTLPHQLLLNTDCDAGDYNQFCKT